MAYRGHPDAGLNIAMSVDELAHYSVGGQLSGSVPDRDNMVRQVYDKMLGNDLRNPMGSNNLEMYLARAGLREKFSRIIINNKNGILIKTNDDTFCGFFTILSLAITTIAIIHAMNDNRDGNDDGLIIATLSNAFIAWLGGVFYRKKAPEYFKYLPAFFEAVDEWEKESSNSGKIVMLQMKAWILAQQVMAAVDKKPFEFEVHRGARYRIGDVGSQEQQTFFRVDDPSSEREAASEAAEGEAERENIKIMGKQVRHTPVPK